MNYQRKISIAITLLAAMSVAPIQSYESDWFDKKMAGEGDSKEANSSFKIDGELWPAFEMNDHSPAGSPDTSGPGSQKSGFKVGRAYASLKGQATKGPWEGWSFRTTLDLAPADQFADGCGADSICTGDNDYVLFMKYAYVDMPLFKGAYIRMGQAGTPMVGGSGTGSDSQKLWDHRYLDADGKAPWDDLGLSSSTERGIGIFYGAEYFGAHLMLGNGEGYHHANAERVTGKNDSLAELSEGAGDSYGYDLYGQIAVRPFGKARENQLHLMLPFRQHNIAGIDRTEVEYISADLTNPAAPKWSLLRGDTRAKKDVSYGFEAAYVREFAPQVSLTIGGGSAFKLDRRGKAFKYSEDGSPYTIADASCATGRVCIEEDQLGQANYLYAHFRVRNFGGFVRLSYGNASPSKLSEKLEPAAGGEYWRNVLRKDSEDGTLGNLGLAEARAMDMGQAHFRKIVLGVTWIAHERFRVSLGVTRLTASDSSGGPRKENALQRVAAQKPATKTLSDQVDSSIATNHPGLAGVTSNDLIGQRAEERQVFIRSEFKF